MIKKIKAYIRIKQWSDKSNFVLDAVDGVICWYTSWYDTVKAFIIWGRRGSSIRAWDHAYLFEVMLHQLRDMEVQLRTSDITKGGAGKAKEIARAIKLLEAHMDDDYYPKQWDKIQAYANKHSPANDALLPFMTETRLDNGDVAWRRIESKQAAIYRMRCADYYAKCSTKSKADFDKAMQLIMDKYEGWWE